MRTAAFYIVILVIFIRPQIHAQNQKDSLPHLTFGGELIFSFADANNRAVKTIPRMSACIHWQALINFNLGKHVGLYTGLALRNIGFIYKLKDTLSGGIEKKYKQRSYTLGIPLAIKFGNMNKRVFIYTGGEIEYAFAYKQKIFFDNHKDLYSKWFAKQINPWQPSLFAGIQFREGTNFKFKYYLNHLLNKGYSHIENNQVVQPFANIDSQLFYFSVSMMVGKRKKKSSEPTRERKDRPLHTSSGSGRSFI